MAFFILFYFFTCCQAVISKPGSPENILCNVPDLKDHQNLIPLRFFGKSLNISSSGFGFGQVPQKLSGDGYGCGMTHSKQVASDYLYFHVPLWILLNCLCQKKTRLMNAVPGQTLGFWNWPGSMTCQVFSQRLSSSTPFLLCHIPALSCAQHIFKVFAANAF